jgi:hypothetical protein
MATSWTDEGSGPAARVLGGTTLIRKIHIDELRTAINAEISRRGGLARTWTNPTIVANSTAVRDDHVAELRAALSYAKSIDCSTDTLPVPGSWTDNPLVPDVTAIRDDHINELRVYVNQIEAVCLCNCDGHCGCNGLCCNCDHCDSHCSPH